MRQDETLLADFLKFVDNNTYVIKGTRYWEGANTAVTNEELAYYFLNAPENKQQ